MESFVGLCQDLPCSNMLLQTGRISMFAQLKTKWQTRPTRSRNDQNDEVHATIKLHHN